MRVTFVTGTFQSGRVAVAKGLARELSRSGRCVCWVDHDFRATKDFGTVPVQKAVKNLAHASELIVSGPEKFLLDVCAVLIAEGIPPVVQKINCGEWKCE